MTDKFKLVKNEPYIENIETGECYDLDFDNFSYIVKVMNDLSNENEELKQFKEDVFDLIDKEIIQNEEAIEWGNEWGADVGAIGFYTNMLKILRKELQK